MVHAALAGLGLAYVPKDVAQVLLPRLMHRTTMIEASASQSRCRYGLADSIQFSYVTVLGTGGGASRRREQSCQMEKLPSPSAEKIFTRLFPRFVRAHWLTEET